MTLSPEAARLKELALRNYEQDEGWMYECTDSAGYEKRVQESGSAQAAWDAHQRVQSAKKESGGYYDAF